MSSQDTSVGRKILSPILTIAVFTRFCSEINEKKRINKKLLTYLLFVLTANYWHWTVFVLLCWLAMKKPASLCWYRRFIISGLVALCVHIWSYQDTLLIVLLCNPPCRLPPRCAKGFTFSEPSIVIHIREKDQQDAHLSSLIYSN